MKIYVNPSKKIWNEICTRPVQDNSNLLSAVDSIIEEVRINGDAALNSFSKKFDGVELKNLQVSANEIATAKKNMNAGLKDAVQIAKTNIEKFHKAQKTPVQKIETMPGVKCWREVRPIDKIGLYIPGGSAPLFSTVLMLAIPAKLAGCHEVILCTPCNKEGKINDAVLFAADLCGISKIFKIGGAQAIAAMAYGTEAVPRVFKIFGPGNQFVTAAKQLVQSKVAIDMPAGPSEVLIIADKIAVPAFVAADLLAQAEHGPDSQVILITTSRATAKQTMLELEKQIKNLPRASVIEKSLQKSSVVIAKNLEAAMELSNHYAPEHLILSCKITDALLQRISSAGSVFIGNYSPESVGDYASGTNHTLPTNGWAASYSGVSLDSFYKKITFQQLSKGGLKKIAATVKTMADAEGLQAHANAVNVRITYKTNKNGF